ncbi:DUF4328 domain-containing protein [Streptomyces sp. NPDC059949]|uniref:DUF4328 domain-containing protein n=1 Tax=Streptomyces sp. NPDC059949 TaxID=3347013 RepID=UPI003658FD31
MPERWSPPGSGAGRLGRRRLVRSCGLFLAAVPDRRPGLDGRPAGRQGAFWPVNLWWASFACSVMLGQYASLRYRRAEDLGAFVDAVTLGMVADALNIVAAGAAVYFAVRLTRMLAPGDNPAQPAQPPRNA